MAFLSSGVPNYLQAFLASNRAALSLLLCNIQKRSTPSVAQAFCRLFRISVQKKVIFFFTLIF